MKTFQQGLKFILTAQSIVPLKICQLFNPSSFRAFMASFYDISEVCPFRFSKNCGMTASYDFPTINSISHQD